MNRIPLRDAEIIATELVVSGEVQCDINQCIAWLMCRGDITTPHAWGTPKYKQALKDWIVCSYKITEYQNHWLRKRNKIGRKYMRGSR